MIGQGCGFVIVVLVSSSRVAITLPVAWLVCVVLVDNVVSRLLEFVGGLDYPRLLSDRYTVSDYYEF
jgi:hypothetical protein